MFVCMICKLSLAQNTNSIYTTPCGHCSHSSCLLPWIESKQSCPQCSSKVTEDQLVKIFIKADSNAPVVWDQNTEKDLILLRNQLQLKKLYDIEMLGKTSGDSFVDKLQSSVKKQNEVLQIHNNSDKNTINDINKKITSLKLSNELLNKQKKILAVKIRIKEVTNISLVTSVYELHSMNTITIDNLKVEIANLKAAQSRALQNSLNGSGNILSIPKGISINNSINHRENQMIYHNQTIGQVSGQNLPPENFLQGCVFLIIEDRFWYDSISNAKSRNNILKYGGSIEGAYSSKITHIMTSNRLNPIVERAIIDKKRCVTSYWLVDVISRKQMLPPWLAHHFPAPYREESLPYKDCIIGIVSFDINEYYRVKTMIEHTGGFPIRVNNVPTRVKLLISKNATNPSVILANRLNIPVVNVQWLNDIICGSKIDFMNPYFAKYQNFNLPDPFVMDNSSISSLLSAWNTPFMDYQVHNALIRKKQVSVEANSDDSD